MTISEYSIHPWSDMLGYPPGETLELPVAARILGVRHHKEWVWLIVSYNPDYLGSEKRRFRYLTNRDDFNPESMLYIGTVGFRLDSIHVFEDVD